MKTSCKLPFMVWVDNVGVIVVASNITANHTHDMRFNYVNEYMDDGIIKIIVFKSAETDSDILTNSLSGE